MKSAQINRCYSNCLNGRTFPPEAILRVYKWKLASSLLFSFKKTNSLQTNPGAITFLVNRSAHLCPHATALKL